MLRLSKYRVLLAGILSPIASLVCYAFVYMTLTQLSHDREKDWLFRLSMATLAMTVPFLLTAALALRDHRSGPFSFAARAGLLMAVLSLGLAWKPISDGVIRWKQTRNLALHNVPAPPFDTPDIQGNLQRLQDQRGKVVLVNIWATWCQPCREEMPKLDQIYREHRDQGFMIFGFSSEDPDLQRKFVQRVPVSYPLLTSGPGMPDFYKDVVRYPAFILIDRNGQLQVAPSPEEGFVKLQVAIEALLKGNS
jgi:thiol-disulfide isomerase/thioredoxin